jgi:hypothetical protein
MRLYAKFAVMLAVAIGTQVLLLKYGWEICFGVRCSIAQLTHDEATYERLLGEAADRTHTAAASWHAYAAADADCKDFEPAATDTTEPDVAVALAEARPRAVRK